MMQYNHTKSLTKLQLLLLSLDVSNTQLVTKDLV